MDITNKVCSKCGFGISCNTGQVTRCACYGISLDPETSAFLANTFFDCLCPDCLADIEEQVKSAKGHLLPARNESLKQGLHYYEEGQHQVFTQWYHLLRGYCCQNGCRHCVYGYQKRHH